MRAWLARVKGSGTSFRRTTANFVLTFNNGGFLPKVSNQDKAMHGIHVVLCICLGNVQNGIGAPHRLLKLLDFHGDDLNSRQLPKMTDPNAASENIPAGFTKGVVGRWPSSLPQNPPQPRAHPDAARESTSTSPPASSAQKQNVLQSRAGTSGDPSSRKTPLMVLVKIRAGRPHARLLVNYKAWPLKQRCQLRKPCRLLQKFSAGGPYELAAARHRRDSSPGG